MTKCQTREERNTEMTGDVKLISLIQDPGQLYEMWGEDWHGR